MTERPARRIGVWTASLDKVTVPELRDIASDLDEQGWTSLWFAEAIGRESLSTAALLLAASQQIHVGTGIASAYGRDALTCAAAARTLHAQHPDRFTLGLGVSHGPMVERLRGHTYRRPLTTMRTYLQAIESSLPWYRVSTPFRPSCWLRSARGCLSWQQSKRAARPTYLVLPEHTSEARAVLGTQARLVVEQGRGHLDRRHDRPVAEARS